MFSATWPEEVRQLANDFSQRPIHIQLGNQDSGLTANEQIQQHLILLSSYDEKDGELINLLRSKVKNPRTGLDNNSFFFCFLFVKKSLICLEGKSMTPLIGEMLFSSVPSSNSLVSVSDP